MQRPKLTNVTLLGLDCVNTNRLLKAIEVCLSYFDFAEVKLLSSLETKTNNPKIEIVKIESIDSLSEYSHFMIKNLNDYVDTDFVLVVQYDGFILNPNAWSDEFLEYDYIGAPWWYKDDCNVGNGGFSLRSKKLLQILQKDSIFFETNCEDHNICRTYGNYLKSKGITFAPEVLAKKFSIEGNLHGSISKVKKYGNIWSGEFGFHGLHKTDISQWKDYKKFFG